MEIFSQEIAQLILRAATNERNNALNRMSLVGPFWHHLLAPPVGDCMPALTREVTLGEKDLLAVDQIGQGWWRRVRARYDATNESAHAEVEADDEVTFEKEYSRTKSE